MSHEVVEAAQEKMQKSIAALKKELSALRAGRANAQVLDRITVDYFGTPTPIQQVGNVSIPEARMLVIAPWDSKLISPIEKAIQKSDIGINPTNDGKVIRLVFPELTEERRRELVKTIKKRGEDTKVAVRSIRRDSIEQLKKLKKNSDITEDDLKDFENEAQKITDTCIKEIDGVMTSKEKEIMEV